MKSNGAIALWDGMSAYVIIVAEGLHAGDIAEAVTIEIKDGNYVLDNFETWKGELTIADHGLAYAGEESAALPVPKPLTEDPGPKGAMGEPGDMDSGFYAIDAPAPNAAEALEDILSDMFGLSPNPPEQPKPYDVDPPNNRLN
ncbi:MAG: hypothetical protein GY811_06085 [Myxococcales bacterium]|nr:hypothetical protein [Myxococcales bacterium]